jgi:hypothetical protein
MPTETPVPADHPLMKAWKAYQQTAEFANTKKWAAHPEHVDGSLWAAFMQGWLLATERAAMLHESVNTASDAERLNKAPGAGAMGAVIEYRDLIRN